MWREDLTAVLLSAAVIAGLYVDGWNHLNLQAGRLGSFFTPWHGLLYAGFSANAAWVVSRNQHLWRADVAAHPAFHPMGRFKLRYPYAMAGIVLVFLGMVTDMTWHTLLGEEGDVARVIAPTHIVLFLGACLLIAAPLRSAWHAPEVYGHDAGFVRLIPPILSITLLVAAASFLLQWISPFMDWPLPAAAADTQTVMAARVVFTSLVFVAPILLVMRRWSLPLGAATFCFSTVAVAMAALSEFDLGVTSVAALAGGVAVDVSSAASARHSLQTRMFVVAAVAPLVCWPLYFAILDRVYDAGWPLDFSLGAACLTSLLGLVLAFFAGLPSVDEA